MGVLSLHGPHALRIRPGRATLSLGRFQQSLHAAERHPETMKMGWGPATLALTASSADEGRRFAWCLRSPQQSLAWISSRTRNCCPRSCGEHA